MCRLRKIQARVYVYISYINVEHMYGPSYLYHVGDICPLRTYILVHRITLGTAGWCPAGWCPPVISWFINHGLTPMN